MIEKQRYIRLVKTIILYLTIVALTACTNDKPGNANQDLGSVNAPAAIQLDILPPGELLAFFKIDDGAFMPMIVNNLQASLTVTQLPLGEHTFTIRWEYNATGMGLILLAEATTTQTLVEGENTLTFVDADYNTSTIDSNNNGISNLAELESGLNPLSGVCVFDSDTSLFNDCNFENG